MKKVLIGLVITVMITGSLYSQIVLLNKKEDAVVSTNLYTVCVDGYKFVLTTRSRGEAVTDALVQHFSIQDDKSLPTQC